MKLFVLAFLLALGPALINPGFTPINLVDQSVLIQTLAFTGVDAEKKVHCTVRELLKGVSGAKDLVIEVSQTGNASYIPAILDLINESSEHPCVFFKGEFTEDGSGEAQAKGFLHVSGKWIVMHQGKSDVWVPATIDKNMQGTWAGGTDMLIRAIKYILIDPDPTLPVNVGVSWEEPVLLDSLDADTGIVRPVDLDGSGKLYAYFASIAGDKLYFSEDDELVDVTEKRGLTSQSACFLWVDFNGDERLDLVSANSAGYALYVQDAQGMFAKPLENFVSQVDGVCQGLYVMDSAVRGKPVVLIATDTGLFLVDAGADPVSAPLQARRLENPGRAAAMYGKSNACLVGDLDGDSKADVLHLFEKGSFLYKAKEPAVFDVPLACNINLGNGVSKATLGDFDADGLLDVFTTGEDGNQIWQNRGGFHFEGTLSISGEIEYIAKANGVDTMVCDVNNDGKQDIFIAYDGYSPQIFFNRGFRSFGHAHMLDLQENSLLPETIDGVLSGCVGDFNHDGAQDMLIFTKSGELQFLQRESEEEDSLAIIVAQSPAEHIYGPITVSGWVESGDEDKLRCLGSWIVTPGNDRAFIGLPEPGPCLIKWSLPDGSERQQEVEVEDEPVMLFMK